jgi:hypothetical protein
MEFENFTPFPVLPFVTVDRDDRESVASAHHPRKLRWRS